MKNKIIVSFSILLLTYVPIFGQGDAGQAGEFLRYGVGSRPLAMGGAYGALANDATGMYWNPAGIAQLDSGQVSFMLSRILFEDRYNFISGAVPVKINSTHNLSIGIGVIYLNSEGYEERDEHNNHKGNFDEVNRAIFIAPAYRYIHNNFEVNFGLNYKQIMHKINGLHLLENMKDSDEGADIGVIINIKNINPSIRLGYTIQNAALQPKITLLSKENIFAKEKLQNFTAVI